MQLLAHYFNITIHLFVPPVIHQTEVTTAEYTACTEQRYNPFKDKKQSICLTTFLLKHLRNCMQLPWTRNLPLVGTWIIKGVIENFIPAIWSASTARGFLSLIRALKAVYINQPQDGNMIAAALVYNTAFYMV